MQDEQVKRIPLDDNEHSVALVSGDKSITIRAERQDHDGITLIPSQVVRLMEALQQLALDNDLRRGLLELVSFRKRVVAENDPVSRLFAEHTTPSSSWDDLHAKERDLVATIPGFSVWYAAPLGRYVLVPEPESSL